MNTEDTRFTKVRQNVSKRLKARQKCVDTNAISKNLAYWLHRTPNNAQITSNAIIKYTVIKWWHGRVEWLWQKTGYHAYISFKWHLSVDLHEWLWLLLYCSRVFICSCLNVSRKEDWQTETQYFSQEITTWEFITIMIKAVENMYRNLFVSDRQ